MAIISHNFALDGYQYPISSGWLSTFGELYFDTSHVGPILIGPRYWVSPGSSNWANSANWSYTSGGPGGAPIPTPKNMCIFDTGGLGVCTLDASAYIYGIHVEGYPATIYQNNYEIKCGYATFRSGNFEGEGSNIDVFSSFVVENTANFTSTDATVSCDGTAQYMQTATFNHNNGTISLDGSGAYLDTPNMYMSKLQVNAPLVRINKSCFVEDQLNLQLGSARKVLPDATVYLRGDLAGTSDYNVWNAMNDFPIEFDGTTPQSIYNEAGCVFPTITVNKSVSDYVNCEMDSPLIIKDFFHIQDGTFNCNGRDIQVGL